jgi:hypothetical protein
MTDNVLDKLTEAGSPNHVVILHFGDPAYRISRDATTGLTRSESIFLRLVAYLIFAETVCVPTRYILEGEAMSQAIVWATPLLEEGVLVPERRAEVGSFEDLATVRALPEISRERATYLDAHTARIRSFRYHELSRQYKTFLTEDLSLTGAFRRTVQGGTKGRLRDSLLQAYDDPDMADIVAPEDFVNVVKRHAPNLETAARRWAMARYYTTPIIFDHANTREVPESAAQLLIKGGLLDPALRPFAAAAPAEEAFNRLAASVPIYSIPSHHHAYCEAVLEVRRALPEARTVFADIREAAQLKDAGKSLSDMLAQELARQQKIRPASGRMYTLISSLLGAGAGAGLGLMLSGGEAVSIAGGAALTLAAGLSSNEVQKRVEKRQEEKQRPWVLAMDKLENSVQGNS